ncbi:pyridoxamine 5'-phosphate oxidase [Micromonospora okii]|uniref:pyridoxamine 5'-phosphate oxidase n=1 Tax=Micromonospora okii TaxID=1182970 RepID=UPI001E49F0BD|nr:pyridoxamine 5'-phosphate oxidase [Micromonospora okii]
MKVQRRSLRPTTSHEGLVGVEPDTLDPTTADRDPLAQFRSWYDQWRAGRPAAPDAAVLATVDADGRPAARHVDLARLDHGFVFFTGLGSAKATDLAGNPHAELCFGWLSAGRQVRVGGTVEPLDALASDDHFTRLPRAVQTLAWASDQRSVLPDRAALRERVAEVADRFAGQELPRPDEWGGLRLLPDRVEFWQAQPHEAPDRVRYRRVDGDWTIERLAP